MLSFENKLLLRPKHEPTSVAVCHCTLEIRHSCRISVMKH